MSDMQRSLIWPGRQDPNILLTREWLVTNGLGGYASGTIGGVATRRFHGLLIAALPAPLGRTMMFNRLIEQIRMPDGTMIGLCGDEAAPNEPRTAVENYLSEFRIEYGLPAWCYEIQNVGLQKQVFMPHRQNTVHIKYKLLSDSEPMKLELSPAIHFRPHEGRVSDPMPGPFAISVVEDRYEIRGPETYPPLRLKLVGEGASLTLDRGVLTDQHYRLEANRGYDSQGKLWSPGYFTATLRPGQEVALIASTEPWTIIEAVTPEQSLPAEHERRTRLLSAAVRPAQAHFAGELVLAADQFITLPAGRFEESARARAAGDEARTVIAGYHWFNDWGRDTMISLEGLTLATGRYAEAGWILRTFSQYVRDGLIPNSFPEGEVEGVYHTADASLWFFHAIDRYVEATGDHETLRLILPALQEIVAFHLKGTRFGIGVDENDGLLRQGAPGYQLTWMDAKVGDWVVTPRRGKAVEINALWYNALRLLASWMDHDRDSSLVSNLREHADRALASFNQRFWYAEGNYLYDVVDGENGDDPACRPNQLLAFSLKHPILNEERWEPVLKVVTERLLTPVGLRSLDPSHPDYKSKYDGDLRARDAAYHQGTVWAWLIGPFIDAWLKVHPGDLSKGRTFLEGFNPALSAAGVGSLSEIFDAESPFNPRGCIAQAWSIAEVLRCWVKTQEE